MSETEWEHLNITTDEVNRFTNAFKSEEFRTLFADYCKEITDPENRRAYEEELKQLEAERGVDVTFINSEPGFVIKTSENGNQKVFINVAKCDNVEKPSSERGKNDTTGQTGLNWRIPYVQSKPKHDFDRNKTVCPVYDVVFHSDTLHLAEKNSMFKKLVIETACDAVQSAFDVTLDTSNLKFPKMSYKGTPRPTIIRKKIESQEITVVESIPNDLIYPPAPKTATAQNNKTKSTAKENTLLNEYAKPKFEIVHRRHIEMHELTNELDAKINITLPKELLVKIDLPLLSSTKDVFLDVNTKHVYLCSETPAKYKLNIDLPFEVDKECGKAQFDSKSRKLVITLPVLKRKHLAIADLLREDSGVESDHHSPKEDSSCGSGDDVFEDAVETLPEISKPKLVKKYIKKSKARSDQSKPEPSPKTAEVVSKYSFLDASITYVLPQFTYNRFIDTIAFTLHVKNAEPDSINIISDATSSQLKFTSIGSGYFPIYYAFYFGIPPESATIRELPRVEAWDNNVIIQIDLDSADRFQSYQAGLSKNDCNDFTCSHAMEKKYDDLNATTTGAEDDHIEVKTTLLKEEKVQIEIINKNFNQTMNEGPPEIATTKCNKKSKKTNKKNRSLSESHCDDLKAEQEEQNKQVQNSVTNTCPRHSPKSRTQSESSNDEHHMELFPLKSILKRHSSYDRQMSEGSVDENGYSCSVDLGIGSFTSIPEERDNELSESVRKCVRFDKQLCRKLLFKMNSTIIGQRKPKENKRKKKKRNQERRYSEGEASDYENQPQQNGKGDACNGNCHVKNGTDSQRKAGKDSNKHGSVEAKNHMMFDIEI